MLLFRYGGNDLSMSHPAATQFETLMNSRWSAAMNAGHFRYTLDDLVCRTLPGPRQFVVQLNRRRFEERRKPQSIQNIDEPFDQSKFNFTKIKDGEIMFKLVSDDLESLCLVNVSPLEFGHSLLVPGISGRHNQVLNSDAVRLGLHAILLCSNPSIRVAFNSLCAHASVNHLHLHIWYLNHNLFVQNMTATRLHGIVYELTEHEVGGFGWELGNVNDVELVVDQVSKVVSCFIGRGVAHNLLITRGGGFGGAGAGVIRVLLWPRQSVLEVKTDNDYNIAVAELAGQIPVQRPHKFDTINETEILQAFSDIRLDKELYSSLKSQVVDIITK